MHVSEAEFLERAAGGLGFYYLILCALNWGTALLLWRRGPHKTYFCLGGLEVTNALTWFLVGAFFLLLSPIAMDGAPFPIWHFFPFEPWLPKLWNGMKDAVDFLSGPVILTVGSLVVLTVMFLLRGFFTRPPIAWLMLNLALLFMGAAMTDPDFTEIVAKPDNVPIVGLVFLLGFFTWLATYKAVQNDERIARGEPPLEKLDDEKILVWPDLVYTEMICMVALTAFLLVWGIALQAPLEEPASSVKTPNPSKAPWYFLGLQEMLVYFDPWMAGVVLPSVVIFGLMAIPFLDFNKSGNGYYTISQRRFAYIVFQIGFLELWVILIILGTFLRGPNWNFFGPFEFWDPHKVLAMNNVDLSQYFWISGLGRSLPKAPPGSSGLTELGYILVREAPGILLTLAYLTLLPPIMAATVFRKFFVKMGFMRYMLLSNLLLMMASLPVKMVLRWTIKLKYIIHIDEYFLNL
ncbi:MAG TPA: hypothetical protein VHZ24_11525 [Pirellulales bacterium]|jgi:hypothetical protein|nr:hypothetical protein [Pirellulales bacterium]